MQTAGMNNLLAIIALACLLVAVVALLVHRRAVRRQRTLNRLLDSADAMEGLLLRTRERMQAMRKVVLDQVPEDIGEVARASLRAEAPIRAALRDVLEHRLWIQKHGNSASQHALDEACHALERAHRRLSDELSALESAGAELSAATAAASESARREPESLRRQESD